MKKFHAVHKRSGRSYILTFVEGEKVKAFDVEKDVEKEISLSTVKRWYLVGNEIKVESLKVDNRKKMTDAEVIEIRRKRKAGRSIKSLAEEYGISFTGMRCITNYITWKYLKDEEDQLHSEII